MKKRISYHGETAIASAAMTDLSANSGRSVLSLAAEAGRGAIEAAGLDRTDIDGVVGYSMYDDSIPAEAMTAALGIRDVKFVMDFNQGGQSPAFMVMQAAMAVHSGLAKAVLVYRALNGRSGVRVGRAAAKGDAASMRRTVGMVAYPHITAMWARRYMVETGASELDMAAAAINARRNAAKNPRAMHRKLITLEDYFQSPMIASPYRRVDCTVEIDGAACVVVTSLERARDLKLRPVVIASSGWHTHGFDLDMGSMLTYDTPGRNFGYHMRDALWGEAGLSPDDIRIASLYDCFSGILLLNMEGMGLCGPGEAGEYLRRLARGEGGAVINPSGGLLAEGYLHGMNNIAEAIWQVQGKAGPTQVDDCNVALACSGGMMTGAAMVLVGDHMRRPS